MDIYPISPKVGGDGGDVFDTFFQLVRKFPRGYGGGWEFFVSARKGGDRCPPRVGEGLIQAEEVLADAVMKTRSVAKLLEGDGYLPD